MTMPTDRVERSSGRALTRNWDAVVPRLGSEPSEDQIAAFWQAHPCGDQFVSGERDDYEQFFAQYDRFRYREEAHIPACLDAMDVAGKRTLEIGIGQGAESEQLIRRGARWSGLDLTHESASSRWSAPHAAPASLQNPSRSVRRCASRMTRPASM